MKITDNVLNGGYDLMDLKTKLQEINDQLKNFSDYESENEEGTNLYDPNAIGIIVYDTPYERAEEIESKGLDTEFTNAREALLEYINPTKIDFVLNYIEQTGNCDESVWKELNVKFVNDGTLPGKLIREDKVLDSEFLYRIKNYYDSYTKLESKSGRIVGIYKNNGEETLLDAPENLIGFAYDSNLAIETLEIALSSNKIGDDLIIHSDQGSQFASRDFINFCDENNITQSMSRAGNPYDNAPMERFYNTMKTEFIYQYTFEKDEDLNQGVYEYIFDWYNHRRPHTYNGGKTTFEARHSN